MPVLLSRNTNGVAVIFEDITENRHHTALFQTKHGSAQELREQAIQLRRDAAQCFHTRNRHACEGKAALLDRVATILDTQGAVHK